MKFLYQKYKTNTLGGILLSILLSMGVVLLLIVLYFFVYLPSATNKGETITVPDIVGRNVKELEEFLSSKDLRYEISDSLYSSDQPPLTVLKQFPHGGAKVKEGRKIFVSINHMNPPTVPVPDLIDGSLVNADNVLRSNELKRGRIELVSGPFKVVKEMKMNGAKIEPNVRVPKGSVIDLVVMDGNEGPFDLDDLMGMELEDAKVVIFGSNLNLVVKAVGDTTGTPPVVLKQKPEAGEKIKVGDVVELWVGKPDAEVPEDDPEDE